MRIANWKKLVAPFQGLDTSEVSTKLIWADGLAKVKVAYDIAGALTERSLNFGGVVELDRAAFPGPTIWNPIYDFSAAELPFGWLIEFLGSEGAELWTDHFQQMERATGVSYAGRRARHFEICFLSANERYSVIAASWSLEELKPTSAQLACG